MYLVIFNAISLGLGLLLVAGGFFLSGQKAQVFDIYGSTFPMALLIVITVGITIGAIVSDTSFYKSSSSVGSCQILVCILMVVLILSFELSAISAGLATTDSIQKRAERSFRRQMANYAAANASAAPADRRVPWIDATQRSFSCCGVANASDWLAYQPHPPVSCCRNPAIPLCSTDPSQLHPVGCGSVVRTWLSGEVRIFSSLALCACLLQLTGMAASLYRRHISWRPKLPPEFLADPAADAEKR